MSDFFDSHTHLYLPEFNTSGEDSSDMAVSRAVKAGVRRMMMPNVDIATAKPLMELASRFPDNILTAAGLHPTEVDTAWQTHLSEIFDLMHGYSAIGEVGIDLHWDKTYLEQQMQAFDRQLTVAEEKGMTVIVHMRDALEPTVEVLRSHPGARCIIHSFTGTPDEVERLRSAGDYYFGINGIVTFKNARLDSTVHEITLSRLLLETDSPYLAPTPHRGSRNESSYIPLIASRIGDVLGVSTDVVAVATSASAETAFTPGK